MQYYTTTASDGCVLAFQSSLPIPPPSVSNPGRNGTANTDTITTPGYDRCIVLMHGFSGSSEYFTRNFAALAEKHWVVAPDMRGHGRSGRTAGGYHVARLAADLRSLLRHLVKQTRSVRSEAGGIQFVPVGCSIGAAVLWTYAELFGHGTHDADTGGDNTPTTTGSSFAGYIFVDQAPLQDRVPGFLGSSSSSSPSFSSSSSSSPASSPTTSRPSTAATTTSTPHNEIEWDASRAHTGCYDEATMLAAQRAWVHDTANTHKGLVAECLGYRFAPHSPSSSQQQEKKSSPSIPAAAAAAEEDEKFFTSISAQCDPVWLARLLADHTRYDHRDAIAEVVSQKPVLVMAGGKSGCFPLEGMLETARRVDRGKEMMMSRVASSVGGDAGSGGGGGGGAARGGDGETAAKVSVFEGSGHWLFYEDPERFHKEVLEFVRDVTTTV